VQQPDFGSCSEEELRDFIAWAQAEKAVRFGRPWHKTARPKQRPPEDPGHHLPDANGYKCGCAGGDSEYRIWLFLGGRGTGKTITGSNWILEQALARDRTKWGVASSTANELESVCFRGDSGILSQALPGEITDYNVNKMRVTLRNGSEIQGFSADSPDRIRGANLFGLWYDEAASSRYPRFWYEAARPAVRMANAKILITTTPKPTKLIRDMTSRKDGSVHITVGTMFENTFLDEGMKADLAREYQGTRIGRQELYGELLDDFEGALFNRKDLDEYRIKDLDECPDLIRIIVGVDPAMKSGEEHDESGIVVAGEGTGPDGEQHAYILDDRSMRGTPQQVMQAVASAYHRWQADCVVLETNQGGDFIKDALRTVDSSVLVRTVHATKGKVVRAEPVSTLSEQGRLHMVGSWPELEDQLCLLIPGETSGEYNDRSDAMIWALYELRHLSAGSYLDMYGMKACECGAVLAKKETRCKHCGKQYQAEPDKPAKPEARASWATAYTATCDQGHLRPRNLVICPGCHPDPSSVLKKIGEFSGQNTGWSTSDLRGIWKRR
jgi:phage terminase large subunit-like protein